MNILNGKNIAMIYRIKKIESTFVVQKGYITLGIVFDQCCNFQQ